MKRQMKNTRLGMPISLLQLRFNSRDRRNQRSNPCDGLIGGDIREITRISPLSLTLLPFSISDFGKLHRGYA